MVIDATDDRASPSDSRQRDRGLRRGGPGLAVRLAGRRPATGGDIDLLVRPPADRAADPETAWRDKLRLLGQLERRFGERKIDVVLEAPDDPRPIVRIAHQTGIPL